MSGRRPATRGTPRGPRRARSARGRASSGRPALSASRSGAGIPGGCCMPRRARSSRGCRWRSPHVPAGVWPRATWAGWRGLRPTMAARSKCWSESLPPLETPWATATWLGSLWWPPRRGTSPQKGEAPPRGPRGPGVRLRDPGAPQGLGGTARSPPSPAAARWSPPPTGRREARRRAASGWSGSAGLTPKSSLLRRSRRQGPAGGSPAASGAPCSCARPRRPWPRCRLPRRCPSHSPLH
mmetsp:Transcript_51110/g.150712  ORF Transcript_51110/g.150712 Transcript_51110/m.150712 type:complete len:239 (+) Transcript_51110:236-952(+)